MLEPSRSEIDLALADEAIALVRTWLDESRSEPVDAAARRLAGVLRDPDGLDFALGFVDEVIRPEDRRVSAAALRRLAPKAPRFLGAPLRGLIQLGGAASFVAPGIVVPVAQTALRWMVRHLVVDASDRKLTSAIRRLRADDVRLNVNLLGEAILGDAEAKRRLEATTRLVERDDVDYVSIKVSSTVSPHTHWSFDEAVEHAVDALTPLYRRAKARGTFVNLDMEEYKDLDLTIAVFTALLDRDEFRTVEGGIVLQAYLPDALGAMERLQAWAAERVAGGGAPVKVRVVKGANLPMEEVDAEVHGWPLATWNSKLESDASYKAVLDYSLRPEHTRNVRIGVAGHNLFDIALAWLVAQRRGATDGVEFEMLLGMATAQAAVVRRHVGGLLLYTPVVHPREFDVAIAYLVRRLEEGASPENFMSAVFELDDSAMFDRERDRFLASIEAMPRETPAPHRDMNRMLPQPEGPRHPFRNTPDTDPSVAANRAWGDEIRSRMRDSELGIATADGAIVPTAEALEELVTGTVAAGASWRDLGPDARAEILHRAGDALEARRADLLETMGSECGKVLEQGDPEVSEAIDFAHYYAERGRELDRVDGAEYTPSRLVVVTPPWNFPVAIPAGSTLAALASGSPVIIKPATQARRSGSVMVEALWEAGVPRDVLRLVQFTDRELGTRLVSHPEVERVVLTGGYETAERFREARPDLPLLAETSGKNAIIVTPSADLDLAAKDVALSAFGHAGQKCSAASLVILVGSVARSERFRRQVIDAVRSLRVGLPWDEQTQVGPIIGPASGKLLRALTTLGAGERWVGEPKRLADDGALWSPGVREGVRPGSEFHLTEYFGPVLGIMTAGTLDEAIDHVNRIDYGLTSGLHSLDRGEIDTWLRRVEAGNLYVNRGITGAIVQRQPFGGWKKAAVGAGAKAGGPNYLIGFGSWADAPVAPVASVASVTPGATAASGAVGTAETPDAISSAAVRAAAALPPAEVAWLAEALATDQRAWRDEFGAVRDATGLEREHNAFRYHAHPVTVRADGARLAELVRVAAAGARTGARVAVSLTTPVPPAVREYLDTVAATSVEHVDDWTARARRLAASGGRIRLIGVPSSEVTTATDGSPAVAVYDGPVTRAGRVELLPFLREQAVSVTAHRFGSPRRYEIPSSVPGGHHPQRTTASAV